MHFSNPFPNKKIASRTSLSDQHLQDVSNQTDYQIQLDNLSTPTEPIGFLLSHGSLFNLLNKNLDFEEIPRKFLESKKETYFHWSFVSFLEPSR